MEDQNCLPCGITADTWFRSTLSEKKFLHSRRGIDVDSAWNMPAVIFVLEAAIDDMELGNLCAVCAVEQGIQLQGKSFRVAYPYGNQKLTVLGAILIKPSSRTR